MKRLEMEIEIRELEKLCSYGGMIEEGAKAAISETMCRFYDCGPFMIRSAMKYAEDPKEMEKLIRTAERQYRSACYDNNWFSKFSKEGALDPDGIINRFDKWFIDETMRIFKEAIRVPCSAYYGKMLSEAQIIIDSLSYVEMEVLRFAYDKEGNMIKTASDIAGMPEFACPEEYISFLIKCFEDEICDCDEEVRTAVFKVLLITPDDFEANLDDYEAEFLDEPAPTEMLSQDEILKLCNMVDAFDDEDP